MGNVSSLAVPPQVTGHQRVTEPHVWSGICKQLLLLAGDRVEEGVEGQGHLKAEAGGWGSCEGEDLASDGQDLAMGQRAEESVCGWLAGATRQAVGRSGGLWGQGTG